MTVYQFFKYSVYQSLRIVLFTTAQESEWFFKVLESSDGPTRSSALFVCKRYTRMLTTEASFRWRLERLHIEDGVYFPLSAESTAMVSDLHYRNAFLESRKKRMLWRDDSDTTENQDSDDSFNINVSVRFKPIDCSRRGGKSKSVALPLHQRLALIRFEHNLSSNSDALNILKKEGGRFKDKFTEEKKEDSEDPSKLDCKEAHQSLSCGVNSIDCENNSIVIVDPTKGLRTFNFDQVHPDTSTQASIYLKSASPLICDFINGTNGSILSYGVTGSGKTYTMFGPDKHTSRLVGVVPRAAKEIFDTLKYRETNLNTKMKSNVAVSYIEVYGNQICDLIQQGSLCCPNKAASQGYVLSGETEVSVDTVSDVMETLRLGENQKRRAATAMNHRSSRAHSIFIVTLKQVCTSTNISRTSKLFLVDLGGCEQTKKSEISSGMSKHFERMKREVMNTVDAPKDENELPNEATNDIESNENTEFSTGFVKSERMREAVYINLGLMALKSCVNALATASKYVPYADSKLTMLLSTALGGNGKTSVIVCAAQDKDLVPETIATLKFAQSCRQVKNTVISETDFLKGLIDNLDSQISHCEEEIRKKERWEVREEIRQDSLAEEGTLESKGFGGRESHKTTILVGAEDERKKLDQLLRKKAELTGTVINHEFGGHEFGGSVGFGVAYKYGMGEKRTSNADVPAYRFGKVVDSNIPESVKKAGGKGWKVNSKDSVDEGEKLLLKKKEKKSTLVYSGMSA